MTLPDRNPLHALRTLESDPDRLTPVESHGLLCAMAIHPAPPADWPAIAAGEGEALSAAEQQLLEEERQRLAARLGLGERIVLPCRLDPEEDSEGQDLAAWSAGFMAGVFETAEDWPLDVDEASGETLLLPFLLFSGLDDDPELDALWQDQALVRQMARGLPELLEELFLRMQAPELSSQEGASS